MHDRNDVVARMATSVPEQRRDLGLSVRGLSRLSGVSRETITRLEHGRRIDPLLLLRLASTLTTLEGYAAPKPVPVDVLDDLVPRLAVPPRVLLLQPATPTLGGAA